MPLHMLPGVVRKENKVGGPPCSLVNTQICLVVFHGMCLSAAFVHGKGSSVMVCTRSLSVMQVSGAGTGRRALVHSTPIAYSVLLPLQAQDAHPPSRPLSVLLLGFPWLLWNLGSQLSRKLYVSYLGRASLVLSPAVVIAQAPSRRD